MENIQKLILESQKVNRDYLADINKRFNGINTIDSLKEKTNNGELAIEAVMVFNLFSYASIWYTDVGEFKMTKEIESFGRKIYNTVDLVNRYVKKTNIRYLYYNGYDAENWIQDNKDLVLDFLEQDTNKGNHQLGIVKLDPTKELLRDEELYEGEGLYYITQIDDNWGKNMKLRNIIAVDRNIKKFCRDFIKITGSLYILTIKDLEKMIEGNEFFELNDFKNKYPNCTLL